MLVTALAVGLFIAPAAVEAQSAVKATALIRHKVDLLLVTGGAPLVPESWPTRHPSFSWRIPIRWAPA
jgi:hypothetical protein